jgi:SH3-like domain-containing protein
MKFPSFLYSSLPCIAVIGLLILSAVGPAFAQSQGTGLPLPRFVSLRAGEVNMRTGPGVQYPVEWVYQRRQMPIEIIAEYGTWRKVRDWQGTQGWIHQSMLTGKRTFVITSTVRTIRRSPDAGSPASARAEAGAIGEIRSCIKTEGWCRVEIGGYDGWLRRVDFWGVYQNEPVN